jgi:hypothetical protein
MDDYSVFLIFAIITVIVLIIIVFADGAYFKEIEKSKEETPKPVPVTPENSEQKKETLVSDMRRLFDKEHH